MKQRRCLEWIVAGEMLSADGGIPAISTTITYYIATDDSAVLSLVSRHLEPTPPATSPHDPWRPLGRQMQHSRRHGEACAWQCRSASTSDIMIWVPSQHPSGTMTR